MTSRGAIAPGADGSFCISSSPSVLAQATRPGVDVAVWTRPVPDFVRAVLSGFAPSAPQAIDGNAPDNVLHIVVAAGFGVMLCVVAHRHDARLEHREAHRLWPWPSSCASPSEA